MVLVDTGGPTACANARDAAPGISEASQIDKQVRVVSTIEYLLEP